jgi:tripartite-type tricarboxylate transporter receptor subunit TctC
VPRASSFDAGAIADKLADAFKKASADPQYIKQMEKMTQPIKYLGAEEFAKISKREHEEYSEVVKGLVINK